MANPSSIRAKINAALKRVGGNNVRTAYVRTLTVTGDVSTGHESVRLTDTAIDPKPVYRLITGTLPRDMILLANNKLVEAGDYVFVMSVNSVPLATLKNTRTQLVLKGSDGSVEVLRIVFVKAPSIGSEALIHTVYARSLRHV